MRRTRRPYAWTAGDIPGVGQTTQLAKGENGVWEVSIGPVDPGNRRSLDGWQYTLHIAVPRLDKFGYIGVYSSGLIGAFPGLGRGGAPVAAPPTAPPATPSGRRRRLPHLQR